MNLKSIFNKSIQNADKITAVATLIAPYPAFPSATNLAILIESLEYALAGNLHMPKLGELADFARSPTMKTIVLAYIGGALASEFNAPIIGKYGKAIQQAAIGYGAVTTGTVLAKSMTHSPIGMPASINENFQNAPLAQRYYP